MPECDFSPPHSMKEAMQRFSLELHCLLVWMRNEARFHDAMDHKVLETAHLIVNLLDDSLQQAEPLLHDIERRVAGADLITKTDI